MGSEPAEDVKQDVRADTGVARALSVAKTILDAGQAGLTKEQIRQRVEFYRDAAREGQDFESWDRQFGHDKAYLRASGVPLPEPSPEDNRYRIDPEEYGLADLHLTAAERLALHRAQLIFANSNIRGLDHALWALNPGAEPPRDDESPEALQASIGSDTEIERLMQIARIGMRQPVRFDYTSRGKLHAETRRVITLGTGARGHWYLIGHDLDAGEIRTFRLDRIREKVTSLALQDEEDRRQAERIATGQDYADVDIAAVVEKLPHTESRQSVLEGAFTAHQGPAPTRPKLRPVTPGRITDAAEAKVDRVINMAAYLLSSGGARPSELMRRYGISDKQLQRDLLSLQQTGTFTSQFGEFTDVEPMPPLTVEEFRTEYLAEDPVITLTDPGGRSAEAMSRPVSLTKPGALGLLIALKALIDVCPPGEDEIVAAAESLQRKLTAIVPEKLSQAAETMALARTPADARVLAAARSAIHDGTCLHIEYTDAEGRHSSRVIEPVQVVYDGPDTYLRAWCRQAEAERFFLLSRIDSIEALPHQRRGRQAEHVELTDAVRPTPPRTEDAVDVVLRFAPAAAGVAERFHPQRAAWESDGARVIATYFRSEEALIRRVIESGGDIEVLAPETLRTEVLRRVSAQLLG
ncbi:helix-turn-helix transcriptional regulator [Nesterenkonia alba]|uniref:helix-turn-helix transcriptional regulator n=1 Tax=Nesterenkonia alba TaxID=515814 RepID=UPI0003B661C7|nr:WYL domain-containing protein [Nesterenkonia alba]